MGALENAKIIAIVGTADREKAKPFYRDTLGLKLVKDDRFASVFELGGIQLRLSIIPNFAPHEHTVVGFEVDDIEARVKALAAKGVQFNRYPGFAQDAQGIWTAPDKDARVAWFKDVDGNVLSLTEF